MKSFYRKIRIGDDVTLFTWILYTLRTLMESFHLSTTHLFHITFPAFESFFGQNFQTKASEYSTFFQFIVKPHKTRPTINNEQKRTNKRAEQKVRIYSMNVLFDMKFYMQYIRTIDGVQVIKKARIAYIHINFFVCAAAAAAAVGFVPMPWHAMFLSFHEYVLQPNHSLLSS